MNKNIIIAIVVVLVIAILGIGGYSLLKNNENVNNDEKTSTNKTTEENKTTNDKTTDENNNKPTSNSKTLVVYYSATGSTKNVADVLAEELNADLFEIVPENVYTFDDLDWTDENSRVSKEHNDESLRNVKLKNTKVENWDEYDTILIGYPIWWGIAAWPVDSFVAANNFDGKRVIPFCTSASSGLGSSGELLAKKANSGNWEEGKRFSSGATSSEIKTWTDSLN